MSTYTARFHSAIADIDAAVWDALCPDDNPFVSYAFLHTLESTGCIQRAHGWQAHHLVLSEGDRPVGMSPCYLKHNSHGEFVFDHAWAHAYAQNGDGYFPKLLVASPYSPVTGPRLLARDEDTQAAIARCLKQVCESAELSSAHVNFHLAGESNVFQDAWCLREDVQYIWRNRGDWQDFEDFLAAMDAKHRKNIRQERRKLADTGISFRWLAGGEATREDSRRMHAFYLSTFDQYGNLPALTEGFFEQITQSLPQHTALCFADRQGETIAGAFCLQSAGTLYGRYWGASEEWPGLHFETCYYQGIEHCLRTGREAFEPGAGGMHKIARGFLPERTRSHHWITDRRYRAPIAAWCRDERESLQPYVDSLMKHSPFKDR